MGRKANQWGNFARIVSQHNEENYITETHSSTHSGRNEIDHGVIHHGDNRDVMHLGENCDVIHHSENNDNRSHGADQPLYSDFSHERDNVSAIDNSATQGVESGSLVGSHGSVLDTLLKCDNDVDSGLSELVISSNDAHGVYRCTTLVTETPSHHPLTQTSESKTTQIEAVQKISSAECRSVLNQNEAVKEIIDGVWSEIDESIPIHLRKYRMKEYKRTSAWKVIRIFISSTFTDFFAEREVIVKKVIPELQEWGEEKKIQIIECDLRWGVPKNTTFVDTIEMMMDEIDRCIDETDAQPFIVCLLGERYGWVPTRNYVSDDVIDDYDWVYPTSMTHMEVIHGALRTMSQNALFMLRDKESIVALPEKQQKNFFDNSILAKESLQRLKEELIRRFPSQTFHYKSSVSGIDQDNGKISFDDLESFQSQMVEFFKAKISEYIANESSAGEASCYNHAQDVFMRKHRELLIGRHDEMRMLESLLSNVVNDDEGGRSQFPETKHQVLFIVAPAGTGNTALLANFVLQLQQVVPELWEFCEQFRIDLIECDLRWGVPKNTVSDETISIYLDEMSRCMSESNGQPFFLNMLGDRYGWIPSKEHISLNTQAKFEWIYPCSITHMEIIHGAIRTKSPNAYFMLRDIKSLENLPESFKPSFFDASLFSKQNSKRLKRELMEMFPDQILQYRTQFSGVDDSSGLEKVTFEHFEEFSTEIKNFFKARIGEYAAKANKNEATADDLSENNKLMSLQDVFIQKRGEFLIGRDAELKSMMAFTHGKDKDKRVLFVIADPGVGKSSLLSSYLMQLKKNNIPCLYNFSSSAAGSTDIGQVLQRFVETLSKQLNGRLAGEQTQEMNYKNLTKHFQQQLKAISKVHSRFVIVLDAVNQFTDYVGKSCDWLPIPNEDFNVRYIISCTSKYNKGFTKMIEKFKGVSEKINLQGFNVTHRKELVTILFAKFSKRLDDEQLELLISLGASSSPLWLSLACEELRIFGVFEQVTENIKTLPATIKDLLSMIFGRLVREDETGKLKEALCYLTCSQSGLTESELRRLLATDTDVTTLPMMLWATIRRKIKPFLLLTGCGQQEELISFTHASMYQTISRLWLTDDTKDFRKTNAILGNYFLKHGRDDLRVANAITRHLSNARSVKELIQFFRVDQRSIRISPSNKAAALAKFQCLSPIIRGLPQSSIYLCWDCSLKKIYQTSSFSTKDLCVICGGFVPPPGLDESRALLCQFHCPFIQGMVSKCFYCNGVVYLTNRMNYYELHLCTMCSARSRFKCSKIKY